MKNSSIDQSVSFEAYVEAFSKYKNAKAKDPKEISEANSQWEAVQRNFKQENGDILNQYICDCTRASAMICQKKKTNRFAAPRTTFFSQYELGKHPDIEALLIEIDFLTAESSRLLRGENLKKSLGIIYKVTKNTLGLLDAIEDNKSENAGADEKIAQTLAIMKHNLWHAKKYHERAAKFSAQRDYFTGNLVGFVVLILSVLGYGIFAGISPGSCFVDEANPISCILYYGMIAGGIGAIISVMNRISSGKLELNYEPGSRTIRMIGLIRPLIGGVFGAILLLLFNSGFSVFSLTTDTPAKVIANFIILGFIAGFFERFVPDILDQTKEKMLSGKVEGNDVPNVEEGLDSINS